jgi:hypothetical protein
MTNVEGEVRISGSDSYVDIECRYFARLFVPVYKFHTVEEMGRPRWRDPGDPTLYMVMKALWEFGQRSNPRRFPAGVYRPVD